MPDAPISDSALQNRILGLVLGQFSGDAVGAQVEFSSVEAIRERFPGGRVFLRAGGTFGLMAGQITDDSELAIALVDSLADGYDAQAAMRGYRRWMDSPPFDCGTTVSAALNLGRTSAASQSNGALMRVSPLGAALRGRADREIAAAAREDARLTHPALVCQECNAAYAVAIAALVRGEATEPALARARAVLAAPGPLAWLDAARDRRPDSYTTNDGWVAIAFQNAFYQLLHAESPEAAIADTVLRGGDTDTNAAIAGALVGAREGAAAFPDGWLATIEACRPTADVCPPVRPRPLWLHPARIHEIAGKILRRGL